MVKGMPKPKLPNSQKSSKQEEMQNHAIKLNTQYITDNKGNKKSVILDYKEYQELIEDYQDLLAMLEAKDEEPISWEEAKRQLKQDGLL